MSHHGIRISLIAAACAALTLAACGGSGSSSANMNAVAGNAAVSGTVTGFGSVIVDGVRIDDSAAPAGVENADDSVITAQMKIGHHVEVEHNGNLVAKSIRLRSAVEGAVTAVDAAAGTLSVLGQTVLVNADPAAGPVTVFESYQGLADIKAGDRIEVHGVIRVDAAGKVTIQATRIEKKLSANASKLRGRVSALSASTFMIGDLLISSAKANITPTPAKLANGAEVVVWIPLDQTFTGAAVNATKIKIRDRWGDTREMESRLGGVASQVNVAARSFVVDGVKVDASEASFEHSGKSLTDLRDGAYVRVKGVYLADGTLKAKTVVLRALEKEHGHEVELHGAIAAFLSQSDFTLRNVRVDASAAVVSCPPAAILGNNLQVEVEGRLAADGKVVATRLKCE